MKKFIIGIICLGLLFIGCTEPKETYEFDKMENDIATLFQHIKWQDNLLEQAGVFKECYSWDNKNLCRSRNVLETSKVNDRLDMLYDHLGVKEYTKPAIESKTFLIKKDCFITGTVGDTTHAGVQSQGYYFGIDTAE